MMNHDTFHGNDITDAELLSTLIETADVPANARMSYAAGYYESTILSLMARFPEVRAEMQDRVKFRLGEINKSYAVCTSRAMASGFNVGE